MLMRKLLPGMKEAPSRASWAQEPMHKALAAWGGTHHVAQGSAKSAAPTGVIVQGKKMATSLAGQAQEQMRKALAAREKAAAGKGEKKA